MFWVGFLVALSIRYFWGQLNGLFVLLAVSVFLSLAIEPGVNRLARRGWRRGTATALLLFGVMAVFLVFVVAIGALVERSSPSLRRIPRPTSRKTPSMPSTTRSARTSTPKR